MFSTQGGGYQFQKGYTRGEFLTAMLPCHFWEQLEGERLLTGSCVHLAETSDPSYPTKDWSDGGYVGPMFLYIFYGMYDAAWQTSVYW